MTETHFPHSVTAPMIEKITLEMVREGLITNDQLAVAQVIHEDLGANLMQILIEKGFATEQQVMGYLGKVLSIPFVSLKKYRFDSDLAKEIPMHLARRHHLIPLRRDGSNVVVAMADPLDPYALEDLKQQFQSPIQPVLASFLEIEDLIGQAYGLSRNHSPEISIEAIQNVSSEEDVAYPEEGRRLEEIATGPKIVQAVNEMILRACQEAASDIHIEPRAKVLNVRFRIDGLLEERYHFGREMHLPIVSRIKILSGLDIAERRIPQDGRIRLKMGGKLADLRVSTYPTLYGEKVVLRILSGMGPVGVEGLGFSEEERRLFAELIGLPHGIFLVTGPTGSGKSTTLYAALERLNSSEKNIVSIEDPIEREIVGISQAQINSKAGVTFASALRAILRQDPDIIMLGEIRDRETAEIAVRAAITGHMVLSTLHTNTPAGSISRLLDLGTEPFLLSSALVGILAQRLVRKICNHCREKTAPPSQIQIPALDRVKTFYRGKGCPQCRLSGYSGRVGIFELAPVRGSIKSLIDQRAPDSRIEEEFRKMKVRSMLEEGLDKVAKGITTIEEVLRVTQEG